MLHTGEVILSVSLAVCAQSLLLCMSHARTSLALPKLVICYGRHWSSEVGQEARIDIEGSEPGYTFIFNPQAVSGGIQRLQYSWPRLRNL